MSDSRRIRRLHHTGTEALISQYADAWHIRIDLKEAGHSAMTIVWFLAPTVEQAKTDVCNGWKEVCVGMGQPYDYYT